jgi:hypothetical protein
LEAHTNGENNILAKTAFRCITVNRTINRVRFLAKRACRRSHKKFAIFSKKTDGDSHHPFKFYLLDRYLFKNSFALAGSALSSFPVFTIGLTVDTALIFLPW